MARLSMKLYKFHCLLSSSTGKTDRACSDCASLVGVTITGVFHEWKPIRRRKSHAMTLNGTTGTGISSGSIVLPDSGWLDVGLVGVECWPRRSLRTKPVREQRVLCSCIVLDRRHGFGKWPRLTCDEPSSCSLICPRVSGLGVALALIGPYHGTTGTGTSPGISSDPSRLPSTSWGCCFESRTLAKRSLWTKPVCEQRLNCSDIVLGKRRGFEK